MKNPKELKREFIQLSRAWYSESSFDVMDDNIEDEIMIEVHNSDGCLDGEFGISWINLGYPVPRLEAFDDSWNVLFHCKDLLEKMAGVDRKNISPKDFCDLLIDLGFKDKTPTKRRGI